MSFARRENLLTQYLNGECRRTKAANVEELLEKRQKLCEKLTVQHPGRTPVLVLFTPEAAAAVSAAEDEAKTASMREDPRNSKVPRRVKRTPVPHEKYLVPKDGSLTHLLMAVRGTLRLPGEQALFLMFGKKEGGPVPNALDQLVRPDTLMSELQERHAHPVDGFVYAQALLENTFGFDPLASKLENTFGARR